MLLSPEGTPSAVHTIGNAASAGLSVAGDSESPLAAFLSQTARRFSFLSTASKRVGAPFLRVPAVIQTRAGGEDPAVPGVRERIVQGS